MNCIFFCAFALFPFFDFFPSRTTITPLLSSSFSSVCSVCCNICHFFLHFSLFFLILLLFLFSPYCIYLFTLLHFLKLLLKYNSFSKYATSFLNFNHSDLCYSCISGILFSQHYLAHFGIANCRFDVFFLCTFDPLFVYLSGGMIVSSFYFVRNLTSTDFFVLAFMRYVSLHAQKFK